MSFLVKKYRQFQENALQKKMKALRISRSPEDYARSTTIGLLLKVTPGEDLRPFNEYIKRLEEKGKKVKVLAFVDSKDPYDHFSFKHFNRTSLNWLQLPSGKEVEYFVGRPFDVLISLCGQPCFPLEYIAALSAAHLRVGPLIENRHCYDLMIDTQEKEVLEGLIREIDFFLNRMNSQKQYKNATV